MSTITRQECIAYVEALRIETFNSEQPLTFPAAGRIIPIPQHLRDLFKRLLIDHYEQVAGSVHEEPHEI